MIGVCESSEALERVRTRQVALLEALRMERRELYDSIGRAFAARGEELAESTGATAPSAGSSKSGAKAQGRKSGSAAVQQTNPDAAAVSSAHSRPLEKVDG